MLPLGQGFAELHITPSSSAKKFDFLLQALKLAHDLTTRTCVWVGVLHSSFAESLASSLQLAMLVPAGVALEATSDGRAVGQFELLTLQEPVELMLEQGEASPRLSEVEVGR